MSADGFPLESSRFVQRNRWVLILLPVVGLVGLGLASVIG